MVLRPTRLSAVAVAFFDLEERFGHVDLRDDRLTVGLADKQTGQMTSSLDPYKRFPRSNNHLSLRMSCESRALDPDFSRWGAGRAVGGVAVR